MDINVNQIIEYLLPQSDTMLYDILLYFIFFLSLITLFLLPDKNMVPTLLMGATLMSAVVAKLSLAAPGVIFSRGEFGMLAINALMFTFPFITAGVTRRARLTKAPKSTIPAIVAGLFAGVYFFVYWFFIQRPLG